ncbi:MAG: PAS domain-containing protein [Planctomycetota bacterium]
MDLNGERFRARMLDTEEMLFEADPEGNVIWVNRTLVRMVRRMPGEILGNGWINMLHSEDRDAVRHAWHEAIRDEVELETELRIISTEGEILPVVCKAYLMHDINGLVIGWLVSFKETTHVQARETGNPKS